jgi:hypothetical protein
MAAYRQLQSAARHPGRRRLRKGFTKRAATALTPRVDRYAQVMVRCCQYSVPARFIGHRVRVKLSSTTVTVFDRDTLVAEHERAAGKGVQVLELDHYLEILCANRARCPARPRWPRPAPPACSPSCTRRSGPPPANSSVTQQARGL